MIGVGREKRLMKRVIQEEVMEIDARVNAAQVYGSRKWLVEGGEGEISVCDLSGEECFWRWRGPESV